MGKVQKVCVCAGISIGIILMIIFSIMSVIHPRENFSRGGMKDGEGQEGRQEAEAGQHTEQGETQQGIKGANTVVWGVNYEGLPDAAAMQALNQYLREQGYDFSVAVEQVDSTGCDAKTLQEKYPEVDIMQVPPDYISPNVAVNLIREGYYLPLSDYLKGKGKRLKKQIPKALWEQVKVDGEIYTIPNTGLEYRGIYFQFNPKYISQKDIKNFNGTIQGISRIFYHVNPNKLQYPVVIGDPGLFAMNYAELTGNTFCYGLALEEDGKGVMPWYQAERVQEFYELIYNWRSMSCLARQAFTVGSATDNELAEQAFRQGQYMVKIGVGKADETKGIVHYAKKRQTSRINASTGISAKSKKQAQAKKFLELAYTDSYVADLLVYGIEGKDYTLKNGLVKNPDRENSDPYRSKRMNFGNNIANTPLDTAGYTDLREEMEAYFEKSGQVIDSSYLGFQADLRGYEEIVEKLLNEELEAENVWREEYFYDDYMLLMDKYSRGKYRRYTEEIERQIAEWKKGKK